MSEEKKDEEWLYSYLEEEEKDASIHFEKGALLKLFSEIARERWLLVFGIFLTLLNTAAFLAQPRLLAFAIDEVIVPKKTELLITLGLAYFLIESVRTLAAFGTSYLFSYLGQKVMQRIRVRLFAHIQKLPVSTFDRIPAGKLVTRMTNDVSSLADMFTAGFISIIGNVLLVVGTIVSILILDWKLGLISLSVFPLLVGISVYFSARLKKAYRSARSKLSALNAFLAENISGMKIVFLFNREPKHLKRFRKLNDWYSDAQIGFVRVFSLFQPAITFFTGVSVAIAITLGGTKVLDGDMKIGVLFAFLMYILSSFQPLRDIADMWNMFLSGITSAERIFSILDWSPEADLGRVDIEVERNSPINGDIEFRNVWFSYDDDRYVLEDVSFSIKSGEKIGLVGPTGSGKTTILSLLMRFYDPQKGQILIDGKDIRTWNKRVLRDHIALVQQDVFLFSGTVDDNIFLWSRSSGHREDVLRQYPEIEARKNDFLQERGGNLSLGERQMISFLRAESKNPDIWILDEATSNMDSESEMRLVRSLESAASEKTALFVAHRLATVRNCDQILVLHLGKLIESGKHKELMESKGLYAKLYSYQANVDEVGLLG